MPLIPFAEMQMSFIHVDDVAAGLLLALDRGRIGESYILAGDRRTMRDLVQITARLTGRKQPRRQLPTAILRLLAPFGQVAGPALGLPPNIRELIAVSDGVSYWMSDEKARQELGFAPRSLEDGLRETLATGG
jgi:nucleoside-diphosphate-sugar epimerase